MTNHINDRRSVADLPCPVCDEPIGMEGDLMVVEGEPVHADCYPEHMEQEQVGGSHD